MAGDRARTRFNLYSLDFEGGFLYDTQTGDAEMRMFMEKRMKRQLLVLLFMLTVLFSAAPCAYADLTSDDTDPAVIHADEIQNMFDRYIEENGLNPDMISVGYVYTATGESWYHNEDRWYYSASLYKVPLMMLYAEKEAAGELTQDSEIFGMPLSYIEDEVLTYSNNDIAYSMMLNLAEPANCRDLFCAYTDLPDDYFSWEYRAYSCFSARFMTEVMNTLYSEPERFPGIAERLKEAQPGHYFRLKLEDCGFEIAQKYGNYHDEDGNDWNHTAGILYTPNPVVLTVLTQYGGISEIIISDLAKLFFDYTQTADAELSALRQKNEKAEEPVPEEEIIPSPVLLTDEPGNEISRADPDADRTTDAGIPEQISDQADSEHPRWILVCGLSAVVFALILWRVIRNTRSKKDTSNELKEKLS